MIQSIVGRTGTNVDVDDDGRVNVASADEAAVQKAIAISQELTATPELSKTYLGKVQRIIDPTGKIRLSRMALLPAADGCARRRGFRCACGASQLYGNDEQKRLLRLGAAAEIGGIVSGDSCELSLTVVYCHSERSRRGRGAS